MKLKRFRTEKKLQQAVISFIATQLLSKEDTKKLTEIFRSIDTNGDGKLSKEELIQSFNKISDSNILPDDIEVIIRRVDANNSGYIDYTEFLMATSHAETLLSRNNLIKAFNAFDTDKSGKISFEEIKTIFDNGEQLDEELWAGLIHAIDQNNDGEIDFYEFEEMMMQLITK